MTPQQLKNSILQQAIEGKLVEQRPEEGNGRDLLKDIQKEKAQLVQDKKIKKEKPLPEIKEEEIPFEIPENWCWCRLGSLGIIFTGKTPTTSNSDYYSGNIPFIGPANISPQGSIQYDTDKKLTLEGLKYSRIIDHNDIIQVCIGGSIGKSAIVDRQSGFNQQINAITPLVVSSEYVFYCFQSAYFRKTLRKNSTGTATPIINKEGWGNLLIPLPPLGEQKRIVAHLAEILPQVEIYAQAYQELQELNSKFPGQLKNSLLQQAIEGKLVEQRPEDGNGRDLLKAIQKEKAQLVQAKKIKKEKTLPEITEEEIPFEIPENWCWCRLASLGISFTGKTPTTSNSDYYSGNIPFIGPANISPKGSIQYDTDKKLTLEGLKHSRIIDHNDIIQVCIGGSIGKSAIVDRQSGFNQQINAITPLVVSSEYVFYCFQSAYFRKTLRKNSTGTATPIINKEGWGNLLIPLPPLAEQKRILAKLEQLLQLCQQLA